MKFLSLFSLCLLLVACGGGNSDTEQATSSAADTATETVADTAAKTSHDGAVATLADQKVESAVRPVMCGCSIASVGHCGNYVEIDGTPVQIANAAAHDLGGMEWCGQSGVTAKTSGAIEGGKFVITELVVQAQ